MAEDLKQKLSLPNIPGIEYCIDEYYEDDDSMVIKGWAFDAKNQGIPNVTLKNGLIKYRKEKRADVAQAMFWYPENVQFGFTIEFDKRYKDNNSLVIRDLEDNISEISLDLSSANEAAPVRYAKKIGQLTNKYGFKGMIDYVFDKKILPLLGYDNWYKKELELNKKIIEEEAENFEYQPKISICMPVYNVKAKYLRAAIESVIDQTYPNWELCIADDHSSMKYDRTVLNEYAARYPDKIKVCFRSENGHISEATNSALAMATGEYVAFMDDDDLLSPFALHEYVKVINEFPDVELIYCDEDKINSRGYHYNPFFKSNWNYRLLYSHNYITHFVVMKRQLADQLAGLRTKTNGAQDYDYLLRAQQLTDKIYHIPKILYSWRSIKGSAAQTPEAKTYAYPAGQLALQDAIDNQGIPAKVEIAKHPGTYKIVRKDKPLITILVPNDEYNYKDSLRTLNRVLGNTAYRNIEVIAVDYDKDKFLEIFPKYKKDKRLKFIEANGKNVWESLKKGAEEAEGDYITVMQPGVFPENENWLDGLVNETVFPDTGIITPLYLVQNENIYSVGYYYDSENQDVFFPEMGNVKGYMGYFFRSSVPQYVEANLAQCFMMNKDDFLKLEEPEFIFEPYAGLEMAANIKKLGKYVVMTPECVVFIDPEVNENILEETYEDADELKKLEEEQEEFLKNYPERGFNFANNVSQLLKS